MQVSVQMTSQDLCRLKERGERCAKHLHSRFTQCINSQL